MLQLIWLISIMLSNNFIAFSISEGVTPSEGVTKKHYPQPLQILIRTIIICRLADMIFRISFRYHNYHALACTGKEYAIGIQQVFLSFFFVNMVPFASNKRITLPGWSLSSLSVPLVTVSLGVKPSLVQRNHNTIPFSSTCFFLKPCPGFKFRK